MLLKLENIDQKTIAALTVMSSQSVLPSVISKRDFPREEFKTGIRVLQNIIFQFLVSPRLYINKLG